MALSRLETALRAASLIAKYPETEAYTKIFEAWTDAQELPDAAKLQTEIIEATSDLDKLIYEKEQRQGEQTWTKALEDIDKLIDLRCRLAEIEEVRGELKRLHASFPSPRAMSLATFLSSRGLIPPRVPGVKNDFLQTLASGQIENFGSHFQDNPNASGSVGDEQVRWREFTSFRDVFRCPACSSKRFKRPFALKKPVCQKEKIDNDTVWGRPAGVAVTRDGALLVSDDANGAIFRVTRQ